MEITGLVASLLRRWYVVALGVLLTGGLALLAAQAVPPTYTAAGSVLLLPPSASVEEGSNQLLQLGGLEQPAALVVAYLAGDDMREAFDAQNPGVTYEVVLDPLSRGPLIMMTVEAPSSATVMDALESALATVPEALDALQDQVAAPPSSRFASIPLSVDAKPTTLNKETLRALIAAVGVGMALTLVGAVGLDSLLIRSQQRRAARAAAVAAPPGNAAAGNAAAGNAAAGTAATGTAAAGTAGAGASHTAAAGTGASKAGARGEAPASPKAPTRVGAPARPEPSAEPA
ncbi:MAG: hypothetical protein HGA44_19740, partial [Cellulomonadaceae bacterium]|nr:hypothetical protein [Cellulomonadaceae bacterium]